MGCKAVYRSGKKAKRSEKRSWAVQAVYRREKAMGCTGDAEAKQQRPWSVQARRIAANKQIAAAPATGR
eukprot:g2750.t1